MEVTRMRIVFRLVLASLLTLYRKLPDLVFLSLRLVLGVASRNERRRLRQVALRVVPGIALVLLFLGQRADLLAQNPWEDGIAVLCNCGKFPAASTRNATSSSSLRATRRDENTPVA